MQIALTQSGPTSQHQLSDGAGSIVRAETGASGDLPSTVDSCEWSFTIEPRLGWGPAGEQQKATAGWLAALPVFEPHWQVRPAAKPIGGATVTNMHQPRGKTDQVLTTQACTREVAERTACSGDDGARQSQRLDHLGRPAL